MKFSIQSMLRSSTILLSGALALGIVSSEPAWARADKSTGASCNPTTPTDAANIAYSQFGVQNNSTSAQAKVRCAGSSAGSLMTNVGIMVYDRSSTADVCCTVRILDSGGVQQQSSSQCSTGVNSSNPIILNYVLGRDRWVDMDCTLPAKTSSGVSHIATYEIF